MRRHLFAIASSICVSLVCGTGSASAQDNPDPKKVDAGEAVYNNYCQTCHGDNLVSSGQTFDLRRLQPKDRQRFQTSVENGKGQMPPWKGVVSDDEIDVIWAYVMSRRH